jgi:ribose-phosphate pyrophosphokinase
MIVLALPDGERFAADLAASLGCASSPLFVRHFPDGETLVRIDADVQGHDVVLAGSLHQPDKKALALIFAADAARELGAVRIGLACPYLSYMRQDARFAPGEAVTSRSFARLLSSSLDFLVTIDPHLHRWKSLGQIYSIRTRVVPSAPAIAEWLRGNVPQPLIVGPDAESEQWVAEVARLAGAPWTVLTKTRRGDRDVSVEFTNPGPWPGRTPVPVDDIISTGRTLVAAAEALRDAGIGAPVCIGVHALFSDDAVPRLQSAGVPRIVSCDTIAHPTNAIGMTGAIARAVQEILDDASPAA